MLIANLSRRECDSDCLEVYITFTRNDSDEKISKIINLSLENEWPVQVIHWDARVSRIHVASTLLYRRGKVQKLVEILREFEATGFIKSYYD